MPVQILRKSFIQSNKIPFSSVGGMAPLCETEEARIDTSLYTPTCKYNQGNLFNLSIHKIHAFN